MEMRFGLDNLFPQMVCFVFLGDAMSFLSATFGGQLRLHDLNVATSVEVVDHTNVQCYIFFGVTTLHGTGLAEMMLSLSTVLVNA